MTTPTTPTFQAAGTSQSGTGNLTVAWPAGHATNDIGILVCVSKNEANALGTANGFVEVTGSPQTGSTSRLSLFWCRATSGAMASPIITATTLNRYARIYTFRGCATTGNPWRVDGTGTNGTGTAPSVAGATTLQKNTLVAAIIGYEALSATPQLSGWTNSNLGSVTQRGDESTLLGGGAGLATGTWAAGGAYGATTATLGQSVDYACISIALIPTWTTDATSGIGIPQNTTEWSAFISDAGLSISAPSALYLMQEASGNLSDSIGAITLTKTGAGQTYASAVTGWTAKGIAMTDGTTGSFVSTSASLPSVNTNSCMMLMYGAIGASPAATRSIMEMGVGAPLVRIDISTTNAKLIAVMSGSVTGIATNTSTVRPWVICFDRTNSANNVVTNAENPTSVFKSTNTGKNITFGGVSHAPPALTMFYAPVWFNGAAEMTVTQIVGMLSALGWSMSVVLSSAATATGVATASADDNNTLSLSAPTPIALALAEPASALAVTLGAPTPIVLTLAEDAPSRDVGLIVPSAAALTFAESAPSLDLGLIIPSPGTLVIAESTATLAFSFSLSASSGTLVLASDAPTLGHGVVLSVPVSTVLTLAEMAPALVLVLGAVTGAIVLNPQTTARLSGKAYLDYSSSAEALDSVSSAEVVS